jgi:Bacterial capsule synthesis protein PGA_cap
VHGKVFTFRAPAAAVETLRHLGVNCVTLENNHALDYGPDALQDTLAYPREAGIAYAGAGEDVEEARAPAVVRGLPIVGRRWSTVWRGSRMAKKGSVAALPASVCRLDKYCRNGGMAFAHHHGVGLPGVHDGDHGPFRRSLENATFAGGKAAGSGVCALWGQQWTRLPKRRGLRGREVEAETGLRCDLLFGLASHQRSPTEVLLVHRPSLRRLDAPKGQGLRTARFPCSEEQGSLRAMQTRASAMTPPEATSGIASQATFSRNWVSTRRSVSISSLLSPVLNC